MTRNAPRHIGFTLGVLALVSCGDTTTEPETTRPASTVPLYTVAANSWIKRVDLIPPRFYLATAAVTDPSGQSIFYAIGGLNKFNRASNMVQAYNVASNTWTTRAPLPRWLYSTNGAGVISGKIYISGGVNNRESVRRDLYMYDPATNIWTQKQSMPIQGSSGVTGVINDQLYVLTTCLSLADCHFFQAGFYRYDPVTNQWSTLGTPPSHHRQGMGGTIGGKFYVAGGTHNNLLDVYDPATSEWTSKTSMPSVRALAAAAAVRGKLYLFGGVGEDPPGTEQHLNTTIVYDPATDTWTTKAPMPTARYGISASKVFLNGQPRIEVVGGTRPGNNLQYSP